VNWELVARANTHPLRISILEVLDGGRALSPKGLSFELGAPLGTVNYHVTQLAKSGLVDLVAERPVRGATEHFYRATGCKKRTTGPEPTTASLERSRSSS
jgi:predicted ArsR family transcriptional regulator